MGEFMKFLPITLMIVLSSSLFVGIIINPVLAALYMKVKEHEPTARRSWRSARGSRSTGDRWPEARDGRCGSPRNRR